MTRTFAMPLLLARLLPGVALSVALLLGAPGCEKLHADRKAAEERRAASDAIQLYSAASDAANAAHKSVMEAFDKANRSANLPDYKAAVRSVVLPAMDVFIAKLRAMPANTPELKQIHGQLVQAYEQARREIDDYEKSLDSPDGLRRFAEIRDHLQQRVKAYREALGRYYGKYRRQLRLEPAPESTAATPGSALPAAVTP